MNELNLEMDCILCVGGCGIIIILWWTDGALNCVTIIKLSLYLRMIASVYITESLRVNPHSY
jgi:hypothetical protein